MRKIDTIIFDWAGTLVDFGCMAPVQVFIEVFREMGIEITEAEAREPMGLSKRQHLKALLDQPRIKELWLEHCGEPPTNRDIDRLYQALEPKLLQLVLDYAQPIPGVLETLNTLNERGIKIGSTSGYSRQVLDKIIPFVKNQGLTINTSVAGDECKEGRPSPFMIFRNMEQLGTYHTDSIIKVGDTLADIEEGLNAGCWTVAVVTGNEIGMSLSDWTTLSEEKREEKTLRAIDSFNKAGAHFIVKSLTNLPEIIDEINMILLSETLQES